MLHPDSQPAGLLWSQERRMQESMVPHVCVQGAAHNRALRESVIRAEADPMLSGGWKMHAQSHLR